MDRARDLRLYWLGGGVNLLGSETSAVVFALLALNLTGSAARAGLVGAFGAAGRVAASPVAGVLADRLHRRTVLVVSLVVAAVAMFSVLVAVLVHVVILVHLLAAMFLDGFAGVCGEAAGAGCLRRLLPLADDRPRAVARIRRIMATFETRDRGTEIVGPVLGGALYQLGRAAPFAVDAVSYLVAAGCMAAIRTDLDARRGQRGSAMDDLRTGLRLVWTNRFLRFAMIWASTINLALGVLIYQAIFGSATPLSAGLILTFASIGGLLGAAAAPRLLRAVRPPVLVAAACWAMAVVVAGLTLAGRGWSYGLLFGCAFLLTPSAAIVLRTGTMAVTPDELQGRIAATIGLASEVAYLLAPLIAGGLIAKFTPAFAALICAGLLTTLAIYTTVSVGTFRIAVPAASQERR